MKKISVLIVFTVFASISVFAEKKTPEMIQEKAVVHIYRPSRVVGFGWVFKLKMKGKESAKLKNGKHLTLKLEPGKTEFRIKNNIIDMNLEPGKHYYLRASLVRNMFLGKPEIVEVTEQQAKKEIANL